MISFTFCKRIKVLAILQCLFIHSAIVIDASVFKLVWEVLGGVVGIVIDEFPNIVLITLVLCIVRMLVLRMTNTVFSADEDVFGDMAARANLFEGNFLEVTSKYLEVDFPVPRNLFSCLIILLFISVENKQLENEETILIKVWQEFLYQRGNFGNTHIG